MQLKNATEIMNTIASNHYPLVDRHNSTDNGMFTSGILQAINEAPTIDPVHAAGGCYCWECKSMRKMPDGIFCSERKRYVSEGDFCSFGERKENEQK